MLLLKRSKTTSYEFSFPDYPLEAYLTPDEFGRFTCGVCHSPITPDQPFDTVKVEDDGVEGKVHCHKGCMYIVARHPMKCKPMVDELRKLSYHEWGYRGCSKKQ